MSTDRRRFLILGGAMISGVLLALAVHMLGARYGLDLGGLWRSDTRSFMPAGAAIGCRSRGTSSGDPARRPRPPGRLLGDARRPGQGEDQRRGQQAGPARPQDRVDALYKGLFGSNFYRNQSFWDGPYVTNRDDLRKAESTLAKLGDLLRPKTLTMVVT